MSSTGFECSKDGFVGLVQEVTEVLLVAVSLVVNTALHLIPGELSIAVFYLW